MQAVGEIIGHGTRIGGSPATGRRRSPRPLCKNGRHRPQGSRAKKADDRVLETRCERCGCTLIRTLSSPRWFLSGQLG
jgi:hypothetical protein